MTKTRLYPPADPTVKSGIPRAGEVFDAGDAKRIVGMGLASRQAPAKPGPRSKPKNPAPAPAKEA